MTADKITQYLEILLDMHKTLYIQETTLTKLQLMGCDITRSAVAKIEVGQRHIYIDELKLIKDILETTYDELIV